MPENDMMTIIINSKMPAHRAFINEIIILISRNQNIMTNIILKLSAVFLALFGLTSLFMTGSIIFDLFELRAKEGHYVPFIVYINFICSFIYLLASYGFLVKGRSATLLLFIASAILIFAYVGLILYINSGGIYETKTVKVMLLRVGITIFFAGVSWYFITRTKLLSEPS